jgi:DHA1 family multidrug resistance protein-like MFS transporter
MRYPTAFIILCVLGVLVILGSGLATPMLPLFARDLGASTLEVGLISSSYFAVRIFVELPVGIISDRVGRRRMIVLGIFISALGAFLCGLAPSIHALIAGRGLWGAGGALYFGTSTVMVLDLFQERRGQALGIFQGIEFAGRLIGSPIGGALTEYLGFRAAFLATGGTLLGGVLVAILAKGFKEPKPAAEQSARDAAHFNAVASLLLLRSLPILMPSLLGFYRTFNSQGITQTLVPLFQTDNLGFTPLQIGVLGTFRTVGVVAMTFFCGYLTDRLGSKPLLLGGLSLTVLGNELYLGLGSFEGQALASLFAGCGAGMMVVTLPLVVSEAVDESIRGAAMGAYRTIFNIGSFIGPICATTISEMQGTILSTFHIFTGIMLTGIPIVLTLHYANKSSRPPRPD